MTMPQAMPVSLSLPVRRAGRTGWWLFAALALLTVGTAWFLNEFILTREVYHRVLGGRLDAGRVDEQFDFIHQIQRFGYAAAPFFLLLKLTLVALTVQLFLLLTEEVSFGRVFLATAWAQLAVCAAGITRVVYLVLLPSSEISTATMAVIPGSVASVAMYAEEYQRPLYALLSLTSLSELAWCVILFLGLRQIAHVGRRPALVATVGVWTLLATLQWAITWYVAAAS